MKVITVVLADDHHIVRQGLRALLEAQPDISIVGEAANGLEAVSLAEQLQPDALVVDWMMPGLNGAEVVRQVSQRAPRTRVIILSMHDNEAYVVEALRAGATAYVLKDSTVPELVRAVRDAVAGHRYLSPALSERAIEVFLQKARANSLDPFETLTPREREVLYLVAQGYTNAEAAERLVIGRRTVETHRKNMMRKLGLRTRTDLIRYALQRGILPKDEGVPGRE